MRVEGGRFLLDLHGGPVAVFRMVGSHEIAWDQLEPSRHIQFDVYSFCFLVKVDQSR